MPRLWLNDWKNSSQVSLFHLKFSVRKATRNIWFEFRLFGFGFVIYS